MELTTILKYLINNLGVPALVTSLLFYILQRWFSSKIESTFQKNLKSYQQKLDITTEEAKFDLQRKIQDFGLYTSQKHSCYIEFHKLLLEAESYVLGLYGLKSSPTYEEYNDIDLKKLMEKEKFKNGKIEEIFGIIKSEGRDVGIEKMREYLRLIEFQRAENSVALCKNFFLTSKLYFSTKLDKLISKFLDVLFDLFSIYELLPKIPRDATEERQEYSKKSYKLKKDVNTILEKIISQMKIELSIGYYETSKRPKTT